MNLMKEIPEGKIGIVTFSGGESSAYQIKLIKEKYGETHKLIYIFCNTGEEDEETLIFTKKIAEHFEIALVWLEYRGKKPKLDKYGTEHIGFQNDFEVVSFDTAYRITDWEEENEYPNHPFHQYVKDYGLPQYPNRTCTREMKERTISRYLSSIGVMPRMCVRCVGIRFDEISKRTPSPDQYYQLILSGVTKLKLNSFFQDKMLFRLNLPSYLGNCGACISKALRSLCTIARHEPRKFKFFAFIARKYGSENHPYYRGHKSIKDIFEMAKDISIKDAHDNRFDFQIQNNFFDVILDSEGACGGSCEPFT